MKSFLPCKIAPLFLLAVSSLSLPPTHAKAKSYGNTITIPADAGAGLKAAAADAAQILQKITGGDFAVGQADLPSEICLARTDSPLAAADVKDKLAGKGREPFYIRSSDDNKLWIIANRDEGLSHGLYFYLEQLGVRFYFPTDKWTIIPRRDDVALKIDRLVVPDFKLRGFFGTGGFGGSLPVDPARQMKERWNLWIRRNRFGGEFATGGHTGEAFNTAYKPVLLEHPEYLAKIDGKYVPWSLGAKLNTANPAAVQLYVNYRLAIFRNKLATDPDGAGSTSVSAEPADGGGHCNSEECLKIGNGSPSDQVFYVANQIAKALAKEAPGARVTLLAYNQHAAVPSVPLERNMYVAVVPYAFQRTGLSPTELIQAWGRKVKESGMDGMGIYDYWSIPDWSGNLPDFNYLRTPREKLRLWHENHINGFASESTYSSGAMGLAWYLSSRLMWDLNTDENAIANEFYVKCFGKAAPPMKKMMERWATGFMLTDQELALSFRDMQTAMKLADSPEAKARVADYGRYLQYLRLRYEYGSAGAEGKAKAADALANHLWSIFDSTMVQSFRLFQLLARDEPSLYAPYKYSDKEAPGWRAVHPISDDEVFRLIDEGAARYQPLNYEARLYTGPLTVLQNPAALAGKAPVAPAPPIMNFSSSTVFEMQVPAGMKSLALKVSPTKSVRLRLNSADDANLSDQVVEAKPGAAAEEWTAIDIPLPGPGRYTLEAQSAKTRFSIQAPAGVAFTLRRFTNSQGQPAPRLYFYVPKGLKTIAIHFSYGMLPRFYDNTGAEVAPQTKNVPGIVLADVPAGQDGKVWSLENVRSPRPMTMLNVPQLFGFYADSLLIPQDALQ